ncbi:MAG: hypothetical protein GXO55_02915 [Chloroflexi bacterium]|nr:hypothetical protein [Chloroflexota bacterium]
MRRLKQHRYAIGLLVVTLVAAGFRFYGFWWGYPYSFHGDESFVFTMTLRLDRHFRETGSWNPQVSTYGSLPFYVLWLSWRLANALLQVLGHPFGWDTAPIVLVGRLISATLGTLTVSALYFLGKRLWHPAIGLLGAAFLAIAVSPLRESHFYAVDTMMVFWAVLAMVFAAGVLKWGRKRDYVWTGILSGLSLSTKAAGLPLLVPLVTSHLLRVGAFSLRPFRLDVRRVFDRQLALMLGTALGLFLLINPWPIVDARNYWAHNANYALATQFDVVRGAYRPFYTMHFEHTLPYIYHLVNPLLWGLGPLLELVGLIGVLYSMRKAWQGDKGDLLVLAWVIPYGLIIGSWYAKFVRYVLPLLPFISLLAARWLIPWAQDFRRPRRYLARGLIVLTLGTTLFYALAYMNIYRQPDTRLQALAWIREHIPPGSTILVERDSTLKFNQLASRYGLTQYRIKVLDHYGQVEQTDPQFFNPTPPTPEEVRRELYSSLEGVDYIIISDTWMGRYLALPDLYPVEYEFYTRLRNGELGFKLIKTFKVYPEFLGIRIVDDRAELTFRLFDHPWIYVFKRVDGE